MERSRWTASARWAALSLIAACAAACSTDLDPRYDQGALPRRPAWVDAVGEHPGVIAPVVLPPRSALATPTVPETGIPKGGGQPQNLTTKLADPPAKASRRSAPAPAGRPAPAPSPQAAREFTDGISVLLSYLMGLQQDAAAAATPVPAAMTGGGDSALEAMYRGDAAEAPDRNLKQFGYQFFAGERPDEDAWPLADSYIVRPGDEVIVSLFGTLRGLHRLSVQRDGRISIPEVGSVEVAGRMVRDIEPAISRWLVEHANRRNVRVNVSLGEVRGFPIQVVGEVVNPGVIDVTGRATVLSALAIAGGPSKSGSLRRVVLKRRGEDDQVVDLYDFLMRGDVSQLDFLKPDDTIVVPPIGPTIGVAGSVQRPAIYETEAAAGPVTVGAALQLAGGSTPFTFVAHAQIERTVDGRSREAVDLRLDQQGLATTMSDGELLLVGVVNSNSMPIVRLSGEVLRPGDYEHRDGMRIRDLLELGSNLTVDAYLPQAFLSRQIGTASDITMHAGRDGIQTARRVIVVDLARAYAGDPDHDIELMPLDHLEVVKQFEASERPTVAIDGAVRRPGIYELTAGMRIADLIAVAGNLSPDAYYDEAELIRRDYDSERREIGIQRYRFDLRSALDGALDHNAILENHDQLIVRELRDTRIEVQVVGEVPFPGTYVFAQGAKISDLIAAAGGVLVGAEMRAAVFTRESVRELQNVHFNDLKERTRSTYEAALERLVRSGKPQEGLAARLALDQTKELLDRMNAHQSTGRVVIPFLQEAFVGSAFDLTLENGDELKIPRRQETVAILGHVFNPGSFVAEEGLRVSKLVARSGGVNEQGDPDRLYVIRADGVVQSIRQQHGRISDDTVLLPGDSILVPRRPLTRSLGHQLADLLFLARRAAETGFILDKIGGDSDLNFSSILDEGRANDVNVLDNTLIRR